MIICNLFCFMQFLVFKNYIKIWYAKIYTPYYTRSLFLSFLFPNGYLPMALLLTYFLLYFQYPDLLHISLHKNLYYLLHLFSLSYILLFPNLLHLKLVMSNYQHKNLNYHPNSHHIFGINQDFLLAPIRIGFLLILLLLVVLM